MAFFFIVFIEGCTEFGGKERRMHLPISFARSLSKVGAFFTFHGPGLHYRNARRRAHCWDFLFWSILPPYTLSSICNPLTKYMRSVGLDNHAACATKCTGPFRINLSSKIEKIPGEFQSQDQPRKKINFSFFSLNEKSVARTKKSKEWILFPLGRAETEANGRTTIDIEVFSTSVFFFSMA